MTNTLDRKQPALIPPESTALTTRSSALVKRALETLALHQERVVRFPRDRSIGSLYLYGPVGDLERLGEAVGEVTIPPGKKLVLGVSDEAVFDLSPISSLRPDDLQRLYIWGSGVADDQLVDIKHLLLLEELWLADCEKITDGGLAYIGEMTGLKLLFLSKAHITDAGLVYLKELTELEALSLRRCTSITNAGLVHIAALKKLRRLHLDGTQINGVGLSNLNQLPFLDGLFVSNAAISDADIATYFQGLTNLRMLGLEGTRITDNGLKSLDSLKNLRDLNLAYCDISDFGLVDLQSLRALERLNLSHTNVTGAAVASLQEALPKCRITTDETGRQDGGT